MPTMMKRKYLFLLVVVAVLVGLDQYTKHLATIRLEGKEPIDVIRGFLQLRYAENPGAAWSLFASVSESIRIPFFIGIKTLAVAVMVWFYRKLAGSSRLIAWSLAVLTGGTLGNLVDRIHHRNVVDFIRVHYGRFSWPTFNVADIAITVGVTLMVIALITEKPGEARPASPL